MERLWVVFLSIICLNCVFHAGFAQGGCTRGYVSRRNLPRMAKWVTPKLGTRSAVLEFPNMMFSCRGTITGYRIWTKENRMDTKPASIQVYFNGFSGVSHKITIMGPFRGLIEGNMTVPVRVTEPNQPLAILLPMDRVSIPLAFAKTKKNSSLTFIQQNNVNCSIFGMNDVGKHCDVRPLIQFDFVPDAVSTSFATSVIMQTPTPVAGTSSDDIMTTPTLVTTPTAVSSSSMDMGFSSVSASGYVTVSAVSDLTTTTPTSTSIQVIFPSSSTGSESSSLSVTTPTRTVGVPVEGIPLTIIIIPICACAILLMCIAFLLVFICCLKKRGRNTKRINIEAMVVNSLYEEGRELTYDKTSTILSKHQDTHSDDPSITGFVDTGSPWGTMTAELSSSSNTRELPPPPSPPASSTEEWKVTTGQQPTYHVLERSSGIYDQPEMKKSVEPVRCVSVQYADPHQFKEEGIDGGDNEYDDPDNFYYYDLEQDYKETDSDKNVKELSKMSFTVPTLAERIQVFPRLSDWQQEGIYAIYQSIAKQKDSGKSPPSEELYSIPPDCEEEVYKVMSEGGYQELPRPLVKISEELGRGQYGRVHKGICTSENSSEQIAVKVLSERQFRLHLLQEAMIMGQFSHPNVLKLHGVVTLIKPMMMVMEYATKGTLKKYLTKLREISEVAGQEIQGSELLDYSCQVAAGMKYLEEKGFVHRNLSAHNVLLNGHNICKISGFVPSVCTQDSTQVVTKREENANIRWTAPESLMYGKYTVSSDVWSYGMLLYEVWTVGRTPFEVMSYSQVLSIVNTGYCQPPPPGCPRAVYSIMVQCWNPEYRKRPSFSQLFERLTDLCSADFSSSESLDAPQSPDQRLGSPPEEGMCMHMDLQKSYS